MIIDDDLFQELLDRVAELEHKVAILGRGNTDFERRELETAANERRRVRESEPPKPRVFTATYLPSPAAEKRTVKVHVQAEQAAPVTTMGIVMYTEAPAAPPKTIDLVVHPQEAKKPETIHLQVKEQETKGE